MLYVREKPHQKQVFKCLRYCCIEIVHFRPNTQEMIRLKRLNLKESRKLLSQTDEFSESNENGLTPSAPATETWSSFDYSVKGIIQISWTKLLCAEFSLSVINNLSHHFDMCVPKFRRILEIVFIFFSNNHLENKYVG